MAPRGVQASVHHVKIIQMRPRGVQASVHHVKMHTNGSPDMIKVAFERKFDENLNEIPPGISRPHIVDFFQYWGWED